MGTNETAWRRGRDARVLYAVERMLAARLKTMGDAVTRDRRLKECRHLDECSVERAYWHAGYVAAMGDVLRMVRDRETEYPMVHVQTGSRESAR